MAHPTTLRRLVRNYETARALHARHGTKETQRRLEDATYTLCVSTGTRKADDALTAARSQITLAKAVPAPLSEAVPAPGTEAAPAPGGLAGAV